MMTDGSQSIVHDRQFNQRQIKRIFYRRMGIVVWVSFLMASIQTMVVFALFDPTELGLLSSVVINVSLWQGYAMGFGFMWLFTFITGWLCGVVMALPRTQLAKSQQQT